MFHEGDLQSGISRAIQEQKLVACFIRQGVQGKRNERENAVKLTLATDDDEISQTWEDSWLKSTSDGVGIADLIQRKAVLLRIDYGSKEATFLQAFCPIEKAPTLVIIRNGSVVDKLEAGIEQEEWSTRLIQTLGGDSNAQADDAAAAAEEEALGRDQNPEAIHTGERAGIPSGMANSVAPQQFESSGPQPGTTTSPQGPTAEIDPPTSNPAQPSSNPNVQTLLAERASRLENERLRREAQEKADRIARARALREEAETKPDKGKGRATDAADGSEAARQRARTDWIQQQAKRKQEAKADKERILAQIEAAKQERKNQTANRNAAAASSSPLPSSNTDRAPPPSTGVCALQIRLFDGSSIKGRFAHDTTLATGVRTWVTETAPEGGADIPYNFRLLQMPNPSRTIEMSEEGKSLAEIGLMPTATLVLVPVQGYTEAYGGTAKGVFSGGILGGAMGLVSGAVGLVGSSVGYLAGYNSRVTTDGHSGLYMGGTSDEQEPSNVQGARMANADAGTGEAGMGRGGVRMKTLADQRAEDAKEGKTEFYNGNSLGFVPRKDDDQGKKD